MKKTKIVALVCALSIVLCLFFGCGDITTEDNVILNTERMTDAQKAVVITAESYYLRGARAQYDQRSFVSNSTSRSVNRRTTGLLKPEDYTTQSFSYHDCSSFVFDVYFNALGLDFSEAWNMRSTKYFIDNEYSVLKVNLIDVEPEEISDKLQEFRDTLQPGDIIVYRKAGNTAGHAMLYVGNDKMIHSSGWDYNTSGEKWEKDGTYLYDSVEESLLTNKSARYLMKQRSYTILRPLDVFEGDIHADTESRIGAMWGIMAEKLSSHTYGQTVNLGEEITFTFHIENRSTAEKKLRITDTVPKYTSYISGADKVKGDTLKGTVTVPARESRDISYKVKVTKDASAKGKTVKSESFIESIAVNCREITIGNTLTKDQQQALVKALDANKSTGQLGIELINTAYKDAVGYKAFENVTTETMYAQVFKFWNGSDMAIDKTLLLAAMVPSRLYGGTFVVEQVKSEEEIPAMNAYRTRLLQQQLLIIGDVIATNEKVFVYTGNALIDVNEGTENSLDMLQMFGGCMVFAVLRPSLAQ